MPSGAESGASQRLVAMAPVSFVTHSCTLPFEKTRSMGSPPKYTQSSAAPKASQSAQGTAFDGASKEKFSFVPERTRTNPRSKSSAVKGC